MGIINDGDFVPKNRGKLKLLPFRYKPVAQASEPGFPGKSSLACASGLYCATSKLVSGLYRHFRLVFVQLQNAQLPCALCIRPSG